MPDSQRFATIHVRVSHALWPGDGMICVKIHASKWVPEQWLLVDREDRRHDLAEYRYGMFEE